VNSHLHISQLDNQSLIADTELRTCLIEAMSLGLPCLHCKSSAINSNMFKNGYNYIEINTESIEQSAEIIINYYENSEKLKNISENAVKTVDQHFIIDNWMKNFLREIKDNEL
jgi:hypothetical protein